MDISKAEYCFHLKSGNHHAGLVADTAAGFALYRYGPLASLAMVCGLDRIDGTRCGGGQGIEHLL